MGNILQHGLRRPAQLRAPRRAPHHPAGNQSFRVLICAFTDSIFMQCLLYYCVAISLKIFLFPFISIPLNSSPAHATISRALLLLLHGLSGFL